MVKMFLKTAHHMGEVFKQPKTSLVESSPLTLGREKLSQINNTQFQTLPNIKLDQHKQLLCQLKPSQVSPDVYD